MSEYTPRSSGKHLSEAVMAWETLTQTVQEEAQPV